MADLTATTSSGPDALASIRGLDTAGLAERILASTVRVVAGRRGSGAGVIFGADGPILTNAHVATAPTLDIELPDGSIHEADVTARDPSVDLAFLRIGAGGLTPIPARDSVPQPGELVMSAGFPRGMGPAIAIGVVHAASAGSRLITADVRLAPGYSGGPMTDSRGQLIGINSMISGGLGVAVPVATILRFIGSAGRPKLGMVLQPIPAIGPESMVVVRVLDGSPAQNAGVMVGDVITGILGNIPETGTGDNSIRLRLVRGGRPLLLEIRRTSWSEPATRAA